MLHERLDCTSGLFALNRWIKFVVRMPQERQIIGPIERAGLALTDLFD
jgi:hypothetical protein